MKSFLKMTLAVMVGVVLVSVVGWMLMLGIFGGLMAGSSSQPVLPKSGILTLDMSKMVIAEQSGGEDPVSMLRSGSFGADFAVVGLWDAVQAINAAAVDPTVKMIYIKPDGCVSSLASLSEIRKSLEKFRESGKAIVAYTEAPTTGGYYLASVADKVYMTSHPGANVMLTGVSSQMYFLKDLLDKFGVRMQLIRHGKYKSAGEMYVRNEASAENREQYQVMVNSLWASMASEIAASRGITVEKLNGMIDDLALCLPQDFVDGGLVDELLTRDQLQDKLATLSVVDSYRDVKKIGFADYVSVKAGAAKASSRLKKKIAVIYADGEIIDGDGKQAVAGDRFAAVVEKVRRDSTIKAVVLRVNSPGGSVLASEKVKRELDLLREEKLLVASYGDYAASGGYWISANCDKIFSDAMTLTGSIGVFGMVPDFSGALKNVAHVNVTSINSGKHSDMYSFVRPFDQAEYNFMLRSIEDIYDRFTGLVSEARGMSVAEVDAIGQGRVWTGTDALKIKLVDEIGTLEDAVQYAAVSCGDGDLADWAVEGFPKPLGTMDMLMEMISGMSDRSEEAVFLRKLGIKDLGKSYVLARMPFEMEVK